MSRSWPIYRSAGFQLPRRCPPPVINAPVNAACRQSIMSFSSEFGRGTSICGSAVVSSTAAGLSLPAGRLIIRVSGEFRPDLRYDRLWQNRGSSLERLFRRRAAGAFLPASGRTAQAAMGFGGEDVVLGDPWHHEDITCRAIAGDTRLRHVRQSAVYQSSELALRRRPRGTQSNGMQIISTAILRPALAGCRRRGPMHDQPKAVSKASRSELPASGQPSFSTISTTTARDARPPGVAIAAGLVRELRSLRMSGDIDTRP